MARPVLVPKNGDPQLVWGFPATTHSKNDKSLQQYMFSKILLDKIKLVYIMVTCIILRNIVTRPILVPKTETPNLFGGFLRLRQRFVTTIYHFSSRQMLVDSIQWFLGVCVVQVRWPIMQFTILLFFSIIGVASMLNHNTLCRYGIKLYLKYMCSKYAFKHICSRYDLNM